MSVQNISEMTGFDELKRRDKTVVLDAAKAGYLITEPKSYAQQRVFYRWCRAQNLPTVEIHVRGDRSDVYLRMETVVDPLSKKIFSYNTGYENDVASLVARIGAPPTTEVNTSCVTGGPVTCVTDVPVEMAKRLAPMLFDLGRRHAENWLTTQARVYRRR